MRWSKKLNNIKNRVFTKHILEVFESSDEWILENSESKQEKDILIWHHTGTFYLSPVNFFKLKHESRNSLKSNLTRLSAFMVRTTFLRPDYMGIYQENEDFMLMVLPLKGTMSKQIENLREQQREERRRRAILDRDIFFNRDEVESTSEFVSRLNL